LNRIADVSGNTLSFVGAVFSGGFAVGREVLFTATGCNINAHGLGTLLNSYSTAAGVTFDLSSNDIAELPVDTMNNLGNGLTTALTVSIVLQFNPIRSISEYFFQLFSIKSLSIDISHATAGPITYPAEFQFEFGFSLGNGLLEFTAANTSATVDDVGAFRQYLYPPNISAYALINGCGITCNLTIDLSNNGIEYIPTGSFNRTRVTTLTLKNNRITSIATDAFTLNLFLRGLDLSYNRLTEINMAVVEQLPVLTDLVAVGNQIAAVPFRSNYHIADRIHLYGNVLQCDSYGPRFATGCRCASGFFLSEHCGYVRCTQEVTGCPVSQSIENVSDCASAPWSDCVLYTVFESGRYYFNTVGKRIEQLTVCNVTFEASPGSSIRFHPAYQYRAPTLTTNR
jgi:Leucine-rich repeat (LRR) protein